jgi:redox-sensitive bicupin YhaK (pirin superfamily)
MGKRMYVLRRSNERGLADHGWLNSKHTFSFADYHDPRFMGFSVLRVINEDQIDGGSGFPTHPHRDMEIISYVIDGALKHRDTLGTEAIIKPGDVQRMSAGTGIRHSEFNDRKDGKTHFLQIWILTEKNGIAPSYDQKSFLSAFEKSNLVLVGSRDARDGSVKINQDVDLFNGRFKPGDERKLKINAGRKVWVQVIKGELDVNGQKLEQGDGLGVTEATEVFLKAGSASPAEFMIFDLP